MAMAKGLDVVLEGSLVLKIGPTNAIPKLATVLLMGSPVTSNRECLATFPTHEGLDAVLSLVVGLQGAEVFEGLSPRMVYVVPTPWCAAIAW